MSAASPIPQANARTECSQAPALEAEASVFHMASARRWRRKLRDRARRDVRLPRTQRRRQDHAVQTSFDADSDSIRTRARAWPRPRRRHHRDSAQDGRGLSASERRRQADRAGEPASSRQALRNQRAQAQGSRSAMLDSLGLTAARPIWSRRFRAACAGASSWRRQCCISRNCCSSMSPAPASIRWRAANSSGTSSN